MRLNEAPMTSSPVRRPGPSAAASGSGAGSLRRLRSALLGAFETLLPRLVARLRADRHLRSGEPELRLVPALSMPDRLSIDVGANHGYYSIIMARYAPRVLAIEPNPELARLLRRALPRRCGVLCCALSDRKGRAELRVPRVDGEANRYLGTLDQDVADPAEVHEVELARLDDCAHEPVGFVKIDVEGHELAVLRGADRVLREDGPNLLIEAEERHRPGAVADVAGLLAGYGYRGLFRAGETMRPIAEFDPAVHQNPRNLGHGPGRIGRYVNNFVFTRDLALYRRLQAEPVLVG